MTTLLHRLQQPAPLLAEGAMGTLLHARGFAIDTSFEKMNAAAPSRILGVHRDYLAAGADLLKTNTFAANRFKLAEHGLAERAAALNQAGAEIARRAAAEYRAEAEADHEAGALAAPPREVWVLGVVGPLGLGLYPYGRLRPEDARAAYAENIAGLLAGGVDAFLFETFNDLADLLLGIEAAKAAAPGVPVIAEMAFAPDDRTLFGYLPGRVARDLADAGADVIGANCSAGPAQLARIIGQMTAVAADARISVMPNAGFPQTQGGRTMYPATEKYFAEYARIFREMGARIIGGCCGTTPAHIAAMRAALDAPAAPAAVALLEPHDEAHDEAAPTGPTELAHKLASGRFVISVELAPPRSHHFDKLLAAAAMLRDAGADVLNIADSPTARMRVSPWAVGESVQQRVGAEIILHFPTRGRNLLRVQGDLLGAHALGMRNLFVCMGDPTRIGDYPEAMDNYDIAPSALIALTKQRMNQGQDQAGNSIGHPTRFTVGCALNMGADDVDKEIDLLRKKIEAGADFALGQPVFVPATAERFRARWREREGGELALPVIMGVMPLYSLKQALYLNNEVPGIVIPDPILARIEAAGDDAAAEGVRIAQELGRSLRGLVQGAYIIPAFGRYELAARVVEALVEEGARA
jgi:homocysteine S-methyltransferase